jgi:hypothetical protein
MKRPTLATVVVSFLLMFMLLTSLPFAHEVLGDNPDSSPITTTDYDGLWHTADFTITLIAADDEGVAQTYYTINGGPTKTVNVDDMPQITQESASNVLVYWSEDVFGNVEPQNTLNNIKLDKTAPTGSININNGASSTSSNDVQLTLTYSDSLSGVAQISFGNTADSLGTWETPSLSKGWTTSPMGDGDKTVYFQVMDNAGLLSSIYSDTITVSGSGVIIGGGGGGGGGDTTTSPSPTPSTSTQPSTVPTESPSETPTESATDNHHFTDGSTKTEDNSLPSSAILIIAGLAIAVLIPAALLFMSGNKRNRGYGRYPMQPYFGEPYFESGPEMGYVGYEQLGYDFEPMYEMEPFYEDEGMLEEEGIDEYDEFNPRYGTAIESRSESPIASKYGRYATSLGPCPNCGQPVRGDQTVCLYCHQRIA